MALKHWRLFFAASSLLATSCAFFPPRPQTYFIFRVPDTPSSMEAYRECMTQTQAHNSSFWGVASSSTLVGSQSTEVEVDPKALQPCLASIQGESVEEVDASDWLVAQDSRVIVTGLYKGIDYLIEAYASGAPALGTGPDAHGDYRDAQGVLHIEGYH